MNKQTWITLILALSLIGGTAGVLLGLRAIQKLGQPAVKTRAIPGSPRLQVDLPERVLDCTSQALEVDKAVLAWLPQDTSFGQRLYRAPDGFEVTVNVVLMGSDRSSLHATEACLEGQGWRIDRNVTRTTTVHMDKPYTYDLPIKRIITSRDVTVEGQTRTARGIYVRWFVAGGGEYTAWHWQRAWWMTRDLIRTGVLQRWAMISYFTVCWPGEEEATAERLNKFIRASAPEIQLLPRPAGQMHPARP
jgi:hypothetical protein